MQRKIYALFLSIILLFSIDGSAQNNFLESRSALITRSMFREPSYISALGGAGNIEPLIFEADIIPYYSLSMGNNHRWALGISPRIILRMYNEYSYPILTPSYLPRILFVYQIVDNPAKSDLFTYFSWFHHSNGQDGSFYNADSVTVNTRSGSFSTNWIDGGVFFSRSGPSRTDFLKLNAQYCYSQNNELDGIYGRLRFFADLQSEWDISGIETMSGAPDVHKNKIVISNSFRFGVITANPGYTKTFEKKRFIFRYTISIKPRNLKDISIFAQYYYGEDYYNIYFNRTLSLLRFGLIARSSIFNL